MLILKDFLASVHYLNHPLISGLGTLALLLMGIFVLIRDVKSKLYRIFFLLMCVIAVWFGGNTLSMLSYRDLDLAILWFKIGYTGVCFMATIYYHFYLIQVKKRERNFLYFLYFISVLELIFLWSLDVKEGAYALSNVGIIHQEMSLFSYFLAFGLAKYIIVTLLAALALLNEYKKASGLEKTQLQWLTVFFFALACGSIEWLVSFDIPVHLGWLAIPFALGPLTYAIVKHQLLDIKIIIRKGSIYSVIIALIAGLIIAVSFLSNWFMQNIPGFQFWMVPLIAGVAAFIIGNLFWRKFKEADNLKYEFIRVAAHQIRTPITHIKWAAEELLEIAKTEKERKLVSQINNHNEQLLKLADILLNTSQVEYKNSYKISSVSLEEVSRGVLANFQTQIDAKELRIIFNVDKNLPKINTDEEKIGAVVQTLLGNAIMYTPKGGEIQIFIEKQKDNLVFSVKDNGIGILKEEQSYIFSRFFRSHQAESIHTEGLGLGLFLVKNIIARLGGKIEFESEGKDKGARFWFNLPLKTL